MVFINKQGIMTVSKQERQISDQTL